MNATAHTTDLRRIAQAHNQQLLELCSTVTLDIFSEARRLQESGIPVTLGLQPTFLSVHIHKTKGSCLFYSADSTSPEELIRLLEALEATEGPPTYDLDDEEDEMNGEGENDAETV